MAIVIDLLEEQRSSLLQIQDKFGEKLSDDLDIFYLAIELAFEAYYLLLRFFNNIPSGLHKQFCGILQASASGLTWGRVMMDCAIDEGDLALMIRGTVNI